MEKKYLKQTFNKKYRRRGEDSLSVKFDKY